MPISIPNEYKTLTPYIKRSEELETLADTDSKYVSYFCLLYAIEKGMATPANDKAFLYALFDKAEQSKAAFGIEQIEDSKQIICENFALSVFSKADEEDRKGLTSRTTAMSFYAAAIFLDILDQFGPADEEISEKRVYAKWRSAEIMKALKEGRTPDPPAANTNTEAHDMDIGESFAVDASNAFAVQASSISAVVAVSEPVQVQPSAPMAATSIQAPKASIIDAAIGFASQIISTPLVKPQASTQDARVKDAIELSNFAIAALKYNDTALARQRLQEALDLLK